jgi:hypothetical protein
MFPYGADQSVMVHDLVPTAFRKAVLDFPGGKCDFIGAQKGLLSDRGNPSHGGWEKHFLSAYD